MKIISIAKLPEEPLSHNADIPKKVLIPNGIVPKLTNFSTATFKPGQVAPGHNHQDRWEVFLVREGEATIQIDDKTYKLKKDDCILIEPPEFHEFSNQSDQDLVMIYFGIEE